MRPGLLALLRQTLQRDRRHFALSSVGIVVGIGMFAFFVALGTGIRRNVLEVVYPVTLIEVQPRVVNVFGLQQRATDVPLDERQLARIRAIEGVAAVYPKQRSRVQARMWGGESLFGKALAAEAFFDGLPADLIRPELAAHEPPPRQTRRHRLPCRSDAECPAGQTCRDRACQDVVFAERFRDRGEVVECRSDDECAAPDRCLGGRCRTPCHGDADCGAHGRCVPVACRGDADCGGQAHSCREGRCTYGWCAVACGAPAPPGHPPGQAHCPLGQWCVGQPCTAQSDCPSGACSQGRCIEAGVCEPIPCEYARARDQFRDDRHALRATVPGVCADGSAPAPGKKCDAPLRCPVGTYCAARNAASRKGWCEPPVPAVASPLLVEMFNTSVASSIGLRPIANRRMLLGLQGGIVFGDSFFGHSERRSRQVTKRVELVGFSDKAMEFGLTVPLAYVRRANARLRGRQAAERFDTVMVEVTSNDAVAPVIHALEGMGFELTRRSRDARKAATLLYVLTALFVLISWIVLGIAALNIAHTFLMLIAERRHEIGVLRAVGATRGEVRKLVLGEAALVGAAGAVFGYALARLGAWGLERLVASTWRHIPFLPRHFFAFDPLLFGAAVVLAIVFCIAGAVVPAGRAARLDPARVLSEA